MMLRRYHKIQEPELVPEEVREPEVEPEEPQEPEVEQKKSRKKGR